MPLNQITKPKQTKTDCWFKKNNLQYKYQNPKIVIQLQIELKIALFSKSQCIAHIKKSCYDVSFMQHFTMNSYTRYTSVGWPALCGHWISSRGFTNSDDW